MKEQLVRDNGYKNIRLKSEDIAEFVYQPTKCHREYRFIVVRKNLSIEEESTSSSTTSGTSSSSPMTTTCPPRRSSVTRASDAIIAQLKGGVRALHAPVNTLNANWAYMVMASLAWTLKAWMVLSLPICPRWREKHRAERDAWLRMEFRTFLHAVINVPAQVVTTGRRLIIRLLAWRPQLPVLMRLADAT